MQTASGDDGPKKSPAPAAADDSNDARKSLLILGAIFAGSVLAMSFVYMKFPELDE